MSARERDRHNLRRISANTRLNSNNRSPTIIVGLKLSSEGRTNDGQRNRERRFLPRLYRPLFARAQWENLIANYNGVSAYLAALKVFSKVRQSGRNSASESYTARSSLDAWDRINYVPSHPLSCSRLCPDCTSTVSLSFSLSLSLSSYFSPLIVNPSSYRLTSGARVVSSLSRAFSSRQGVRIPEISNTPTTPVLSPWLRKRSLLLDIRFQRVWLILCTARALKGEVIRGSARAASPYENSWRTTDNRPPIHDRRRTETNRRAVSTGTSDLCR